MLSPVSGSRTGLGLALGALVLLSAVFLGISLVTLAVAVLAVAIFLWRKRSESGEEGAPTGSDAAREEAPEWVMALQRMLELNLLAREKAAPEAVLEKIEQTVDDLRRLIPELNQAHSGDDLTWTVNRMALDYVPRLVEPFLALDPAARDERQEQGAKDDTQSDPPPLDDREP